MHALVLDANSDDCAMAIRHLGQAGYETIAIESIREARETLERSTFDLMLIELRLVDGNSFPLCAEIRERFGDDPVVILVSRECTPAQCILGLELGADDVMSKPYDIQELLARIEARRRRRAPSSA